MLKLIKVGDLVRWGACYPPRVLKGWVGGGVTVEHVADPRFLSRDILLSDRLWVLLRPEIVAEQDLRALTLSCAERALRKERKAGREPHHDSWEAVRVARRFVQGRATKFDLARAKNCAESAYWAARSTVGQAAGSAAWAAWAASASFVTSWATANGAAESVSWAARAIRAASSSVGAAAYDATSGSATAATSFAAALGTRYAAKADATDAEHQWQLRQVRHILRNRTNSQEEAI